MINIAASFIWIGVYTLSDCGEKYQSKVYSVNDCGGGERSNRMSMVESIRPAAIDELGKLICTSPTNTSNTVL